jgi:hypothetical protein
MSNYIIQAKIEVIDNNLFELTGKEDSMLIDIAINLNDITAIRQKVNEEGIVEEGQCIVYLKCGENFTIFSSYETILLLMIKGGQDE